MSKQEVPRTEAVNPLTKGIDSWPAGLIVQAMSAEDHRVAPAVAKESPRIARAAELMAKALASGGRVFYIGSGTSGRIGVLDASEIEPTFGDMGRRFEPLIAGGPVAVFKAVEGAEDSADSGFQEIASSGVGPHDAVVGIASSGRTPYVAGGLRAARVRGAATIAVVGDASGPVSEWADVVIAPDVGPEVVAGSTRLKNGTAQKMVLNMISTTAMILSGRVYSNLMAGTSPRNNKLSGRARRILMEATGRSPEDVESALVACGGNIAVALVSLESGTGRDASERFLNECAGSIPEAVRRAKGQVAALARPVTDPHVAAPLLATGSARDAELNEAQVERAFDVIRNAVGDGEGSIPGAVAAIVRGGVLVGPRAFGWAVRTPERIAATPSTMFDMASLTKVTATTPSVLIACERGLLRFEDPVALFIPEFAAAGKEGVTLRHLLTHSSGLLAHVKFWEKGLKEDEILPFICSLPLEDGARPGAQAVYSDLGFILLGEVLRRATGLRLDEFAAREVFGPLGMSDTRFTPPACLRSRIAATEYRADLGRVMWGEVHDENALALGGVAGHAGLFSTAPDLARYALMWLGKGEFGGQRVLSPATVAASTREQIAATGERRAIGWALKSQKLTICGDLLSPGAFGHTGFTGTSLVCDPANDLAVILLTNRVHAGRETNDVIRLRPLFANAVAASVGR